MIILGIDPALASLGYAIADFTDNKINLLDYGVIKTPAHTPTGERLNKIERDLTDLIVQYKPERMALEKPFSFKQKTKNESLVHQVLGVIQLVCHQQGLGEPLQFAPSQVKKAVTGNGGADKAMVKAYLETLFGELRGRDDGVDAIGVIVATTQVMEVAA